MTEGNITLTLEDYLASGYELPTNLDNFQVVEIGNFRYDIKELFKVRNKYKEIGSEVEERFKHNLEVLVNSALAIYNPRLILLNNNFDNLMKRTVEESEEITTSNEEK